MVVTTAVNFGLYVDLSGTRDKLQNDVIQKVVGNTADESNFLWKIAGKA